MNRKELVPILAVLLAFASISTDLYLPAMPSMALSLGAHGGDIQLSVPAYLLGFSLGQLFWGPLGDRFGRRPPIMLGLALFVLASGGCALAGNAVHLIAWRVVQAVGASASVVLARAIVRDLYERDEAARVLSRLMTIMAIAPLLGPIIGGFVLRVADWRAIFWVLTAIGVLAFAAVFRLPETLAAHHRGTQTVSGAFKAYGSVLRSRHVLGYTAAVGVFYSGVFANISGSSFAYIEYHGLAPQLYGIVFAVGVAGLIITSQLNARFVRLVGADRMLRIGGVGAAAAGVALAVLTATDLGGVVGMAVCLWCFTAMNGFITANAVSGAAAGFPKNAGAVSAVTGAVQYGSGVLGSAIVAAFADGSPLPMGLVIAFSGLGCLVSVFVLIGSPLQWGRTSSTNSS